MMENLNPPELKSGFLVLPQGHSFSGKSKRIVSVVPSLTELLYELGLNDEVVGITRFCIHPEVWFRSKKRVGGTKKLHLEAIAEMEPDWVIANKEENTKADIETLAKTIPVYVSDVESLQHALDMIEDVGCLTQKEQKAATLISQIKDKFTRLSEMNFPVRRVAYLIWKNPWMAAGSHTFINEMMRFAGFENIFEQNARYPEFELEVLKTLQPELILLSSEPYPFEEKHRAELQAYFPGSRVILVDGEMFSWYGSRLLGTPDYLTSLRKNG